MEGWYVFDVKRVLMRVGGSMLVLYWCACMCVVSSVQCTPDDKLSRG